MTPRRSPIAIFFLLPAAALLGAFVVWPMARALWLSLHNAPLLNLGASRWVGAGNYGDLIEDPRFRRAFLNTALFALMVVPLQTAIAFFAALWVNRPERHWRWLRVVFFVPIIISMPVLAILWTMLYQPAQGEQMGLVNRAVTLVGLEPRAWLREPRLALPAIAFMSIWQGLGLQMIVFLAGLQHLSTTQLEAARIDGANAFQRLVYVIVPGMKNSFVFTITVTTILAFRLFTQPYLMTRGGPEDSTLSIIQYIYEVTFTQYSLGLATAATMLFLVLVAALTLLQRLAAGEERD